MRGGFVHNCVLLQPIIDLVRRRHGTVIEEFAVRSEQITGSIDVLITLGDVRIACEAEMTFGRLQRDILKAQAADADLLLIVTPDAVTARAMTVLAACHSNGKPRIKCAVLSDAIKALEAL